MKGNQNAKGCTTSGKPPKYTEEWIREEAKILIAWVKKDEGFYLGDFAFERGYGWQRLSEFVKKSPEFADAMELAKQWQERKFLHNGLSKEWDSAQVRYTMARVCGDRWKASYDSAIDPDSLKQAVKTAVIDYENAQSKEEGWQKPNKS